MEKIIFVPDFGSMAEKIACNEVDSRIIRHILIDVYCRGYRVGYKDCASDRNRLKRVRDKKFLRAWKEELTKIENMIFANGGY